MAAPAEMQRGASRARDAMRRHDVLASGILTGIAGSAAMLAAAAIGATSQELAATHALELVGESFVGADALDPAGKVAFGAFVHLATSILLATLLASIVPRDFPMASAIGVGVAFGLFTLMLMMTLIVPWANPGFRRGMQAIGGTWVVAHAVFGAVAGMSPALRRWLVGETGGAPAPNAERIRPRPGAVARTMR